MGTFFLYSAVLILSCFFSLKSEKSMKKHHHRQSLRFRILLILLLTVISGFRGENVGVDTYGYYYIFVKQGVQYGLESGFSYIVKLLMAVTGSPRFLFVLFAFVTQLFFVNGFWNLRPHRLPQPAWCVLSASWPVPLWEPMCRIQRHRRKHRGC